ncbi:hypothetical protein AAEU32_07690 [Pseudoalteromonas sp. SSDWG2]|uniref:hypothetical protein n=1 Tax=Pseudoalteromonas sp. SSDWG2 TaxID=3139391 RepID=UPI003BA90977
MKIAIVETRGIPNRYGGYEQFAEIVRQYWVKSGHEVICYNPHEHYYEESVYNHFQIVKSVDVLLPNSTSELERVREDMLFTQKQRMVVPNAADGYTVQGPDEPAEKTVRYPENEGLIKAVLVRNMSSLVKLKSKILGSGTSKNK